MSAFRRYSSGISHRVEGLLPEHMFPLSTCAPIAAVTLCCWTCCSPSISWEVLIIQTSWAVFFLRLQHKQGAGATRKWNRRLMSRVKSMGVALPWIEVECAAAEWQISSMWQVVCLLQFKLLDTNPDAATQAAWDELMNFTLIWHCCTKYMAYSCKIYAWCMRVWVCVWVCMCVWDRIQLRLICINAKANVPS